MKTIFTILLITISMVANAQTVVAVEKANGTTDTYNLADVDSVVYEQEVSSYTLTLADGTDVTSKYKCTTTPPVRGSRYETYSSLSNTFDTATKIYCDKNFELWWCNSIGGKWENYGGTINYSSIKSKYVYTIPSGIEWFLYIKG